MTSRAPSIMRASRGWATIGASVPSRSRNRADWAGCVTSGAHAAAAKETDTVIEASSVRDHRAVLLITGACAGLFSALFGVGGGVVIVPMLVSFGGYGTKRATSTSLAAIIFIAVWGTLA